MDLYAGAYDGSVGASNSVFSNIGAAIGMVFVYMFAIYSLANSSFKLIDAIPDNFGRWGGLPKGFGSGIKTGMSDISKLIVGGAILNRVTGAAKQGRANQAASKQKEKSAQEQAALEARLNNIESKL